MELYQLRFQIEFLFRDAKQNTGLGHAQTLDAQGQDYFENTSLTALNFLGLEESDQAINHGGRGETAQLDSITQDP